MLSLSRFFLAPALLLASLASANADEFPSKLIKIVVPDAPGGNFDLIARAVGASLAVQLKQPVVVDNKPGGSTTIGAAIVARAPADGYTLLFTGSTHATVKQFVPGTTYDPLNDFEPVSIIATSPLVVAVSANSPFQTVEDLVRKAKSEPDRLTVGTLGPGSGSNTLMRDLMPKIGIELRRIPYKGAPSAINALMAGEIDVAILTPLTSLRLVEAGKLRALAVSSKTRLDTMPNVPTISETIMPGYAFDWWFALLAQKNVPQAVLARIFDAVQAYIADAQTKKFQDSMGLQPVKLTFQQTVDFFVKDSERLVDMAKKATPTE